jgi:hypothetical protein
LHFALGSRSTSNKKKALTITCHKYQEENRVPKNKENVFGIKKSNSITVFKKGN